MENNANCGAVSARENYDLCALGLLEGPEAEQIESHLARQCSFCIEGIRDGQRLWYFLGSAQASEIPGAPRRALRNRILNSVRRETNSFSWGFFPLTWPVAANAALAAGMVATSWYAYKQSSSGQPPAPADDHTVSITRLESEIRALRQRAETAEQARAAAPSQVQPTPPVRVEDPALQQALAVARTEIQDTLNRLTQEQARAQQLETELTAGRTQLSEARRAREEAERIAATLPSERARLVAREQEIAVLNTRVQQLERENTRYRETVSQLRRELDYNLRMASFLSSPTLQVVKLRGTESGKQAIGHAFIVDGQRLVFYASNLPALAPGRTYQLWVLRGRTPAIVSGGLFAGNVGQRNPVEFVNPSLLNDVRGLAVTDEPLGGSPGPTGNKFLVGTLRPL